MTASRSLLPFGLVAFALSGIFLVAGLQYIGIGQVVIGPLASGLLYAAYGLALVRCHRLAFAKHWWAAALPTILTPLGIVALLVTIWLTVAVRRAKAHLA